MHDGGINTNAGGRKLPKPSIISGIRHELDEHFSGLLRSG